MRNIAVETKSAFRLTHPSLTSWRGRLLVTLCNSCLKALGSKDLLRAWSWFIQVIATSQTFSATSPILNPCEISLTASFTIFAESVTYLDKFDSVKTLSKHFEYGDPVVSYQYLVIPSSRIIALDEQPISLSYVLSHPFREDLAWRFQGRIFSLPKTG